MLKAIRKNLFVNKVIRNLLLKITNLVPSSRKRILTRWRLSGEIPLSLNNHSFKMWSECDDLIVDAVYYGWNDEELEMELFAELAKRSNTILDIGANTGIYSILAKAINPSAKIFAFEPYPANVTRLNINRALNNSTSISIIPKAVGRSNDTLTFTIPSDGRISTVASLNGEFTRQFHVDELRYHEMKVDCITLDSFYQQASRLGMTLIKIDVESFEIEVFEGATELLTKENPIILCEIFLTERAITYFENKLTVLGFEKYGIFPDRIQYLNRLEKLSIRNFVLVRRRTSKNVYSKLNLHEFVTEISGQTD